VIPAGLPKELAEGLAQVLDAARNARTGPGSPRGLAP
jgi:hypothetical protein